MQEEKKDVKEVVVPPKKEGEVEIPSNNGNDKETNFANLRKAKEDAETERDELKKKLAEKEGADRSLEIEGENGGKEKKPEKDSDALKTIFKRDMKEATLQWNKKNNVSSEEWATLKSKVKLTGEETVSEIYEKIDEAYQALPTVRAKRDKELIDKGKKEAMRDMSDDEMDFGGGGDGDLGDGSKDANLKPGEKKFLRSFGVTPDEMKNIDKTKNTNQWQVGKSPTRKFFGGGSS